MHYGLCDNGEFRKTDSQEQTRLRGESIVVCISLMKVSLFSLINSMIYYSLYYKLFYKLFTFRLRCFQPFNK